MNRILRFALVALFVTTASLGFAQQTVTFTAGTDKGANTSASGEDQVTKDGITISTTAGGFAAPQFRFAKGSVNTFTSTVGNITKVEFTCTASGTTKWGPGCFTDPSTGSYTYADKVGTWTGDAASFTITASSAQVRATQIVVTYTPGSTPVTQVTAPTIEGETPFAEQTTVTIAGAEGTTVYYTTDGSTPNDQGNEYTDPFTITETTTVKAIAYDADGNTSDMATKTFTKQSSTQGLGTAASPYTAADALALAKALAAGANSDEVYVKGIVSQVREVSTSYGNAGYDISDDGTTTNQFYIFRGNYLDGAKFTSKDQIQVGDTVLVKGKLTNYKGNTPEMAQGNQIVSLSRPGGTKPVAGDTKALPYEESFAASQGDFTITNVRMDASLSYVWQWNNSKYMRASAYMNKKNLEAESWLVSPKIDLTKATAPELTFEQTGKFFGTMTDEATVWVIAGTDTTQLGVPTYMTGKNWTFVQDTISLKAFAGKVVQVAFRYVSTTAASPTWEVKNFAVKDTASPVATDKGTVDNPYTPSEVLALATLPDAEVYVKGTVVKDAAGSDKYKNADYFLSDDGTTTGQMKVFRGKWLDGEGFTSAQTLKAGDVVVLRGKLALYNGANQVAAGSSLVSINGQTSGIGTITTAEKLANAPHYNLAGQRVGNAYKGIVIVNGRKYLNK